MKLSIITINRNNAAGLEKTIRSVMGQTYTNFEYIIVDGASTDNSVEVIKDLISPTPDPSPEGEGGEDSEENGWRYCALSQSALPSLSGEGQGVRLHWISEPDKGIYNAMNKGIVRASGDYLFFLNSGDTFVDNDVLKAVAEGGMECDIVVGRINFVSNEGVQFTNYQRVSDKITLYSFVNSLFPHQATFIKRELFLKYGLYEEKYKIVADWQFFLKTIVMENCSCQCIPVTISDFDNSGLTSTNGNKMMDEIEDAFKDSLPERIYLDYCEAIKMRSDMGRLVWIRSHPFFHKLFRFCVLIGRKIFK